MDKKTLFDFDILINLLLQRAENIRSKSPFWRSTMIVMCARRSQVQNALKFSDRRMDIL